MSPKELARGAYYATRSKLGRHIGLVIETVDLGVVCFLDVSEEFALAEGEINSLSSWRSDHIGYFEHNGGFDCNMKVLCERFRLVEDLGS